MRKVLYVYQSEIGGLALYRGFHFFNSPNKTLKLISLLLPLLFSTLYTASAQTESDFALFDTQKPLEIQMSFSIKDIKKNKDESVFATTFLEYKNQQGNWDTLKVELRARGNFRRDKCFFPPIKMKVKKKASKGSIFEGHKNFKLVLPCNTAQESDALIVKEFLCYKLYEPISPYHFNTRLVNLTVTDENSRQRKPYTLKAILIEDDARVAGRFNGKIMKGVQLSPMRIHDTTSVKHDFFQFMIANTDWSTFAQHNITIMQVGGRHYIPLCYDFDMSGIVNAPYAIVNNQLMISSVRERLYRGFCRDPALFEHVRSEYLALEPEIWKSFESIAAELSTYHVQDLKKFLTEFFTILQNDKKFKDQILSACRTG